MLLSLTKETIDNIIHIACDAEKFLFDIAKNDHPTIVSDKTNYYAFSYSFVIYSQAILTLSNYIAIRRELGVPKSFYESLLLLIDNNIIQMDDAKDYAKLLVDLRNAVLHGNTYENVEDKINTILKNLSIFKQFFESVISEVQRILGN